MPEIPSDLLVAVLHQGQPGSADPTIQNAWRLQHDLRVALGELGIRTEAVFLDDGFQFVPRLLEIRPGLVFNAADLGFGYDITLEPYVGAVLDGAGLHYTGAHAYGSAFSSDKYAAKLYLLRLGVPVPKVWLASEPDGVEFPAILKSRFGHNSFGMDSSSVVRDAAALAGKVSDLGRHADQFVLEEFVDGEEVAAAFLGNDPRQALPQFQVVWGPAFEGRPRILDFDSKWSAESDVYHQSTPQRCTLPAEAQAAVDRALLLAASHLSMRDYGRCDFRVRRDDGAGWVPYLIDVNTNPDLSQDAGFFRMAKAAGLDYPRAIGRIVGAALQRPRRRGPLVGSGGLAGA